MQYGGSPMKQISGWASLNISWWLKYFWQFFHLPGSRLERTSVIVLSLKSATPTNSTFENFSRRVAWSQGSAQKVLKCQKRQKRRKKTFTNSSTKINTSSTDETYFESWHICRKPSKKLVHLENEKMFPTWE